MAALVTSGPALTPAFERSNPPTDFILRNHQLALRTIIQHDGPLEIFDQDHLACLSRFVHDPSDTNRSHILRRGEIYAGADLDNDFEARSRLALEKGDLVGFVIANYGRDECHTITAEEARLLELWFDAGGGDFGPEKRLTTSNPPTGEILKNHELALRAIAQHGTNLEMFDHSELHLLRDFVQEPSPENKVRVLSARGIHSTSDQDDNASMMALQKKSLAGYVIANFGRKGYEDATISTKEVKWLKEWFDLGGGNA